MSHDLLILIRWIAIYPVDNTMQSGPEFTMAQEGSYTTANRCTGLPVTKPRIAQFIITSLHEYKQN